MKGVSHVCVVQHADSRQSGVLKTPRTNGGKVTTTTQERFQREVRWMQQLTGEEITGIVPVLDADPHDPPKWFVMPQAQTLRSALSPRGLNAELREVVASIREIADTLARLHKRGIAHRDIKPDNLLYAQQRPLVADFGIAGWPERPQLTAVGAAMGPLYFLAPEMRSFDPKKPAFDADVWSLAKTLFVLAKGLEFPPEGTHYEQGRAYSLWAEGAEASMDLTPVLEAATAYEPNRRLTMASFRDELSAWLELHPDPVSPSHPAFRRGLRALKAATAETRRHEDELRRMLPPQMRLLAWAQHGQSTHWLGPAVDARSPEDVKLLDLHGYPDDPDYNEEVDGMCLMSTLPDEQGRRIVLGGFLMGTVTTLAAELQQDGALLDSWSEDVNILLPTAAIALRRMTQQAQDAIVVR
ncbi:protein kinase domain-containing protein [Streptomyces purpurogeneiscleroticus]|uniref:protein kinase domain-containing protein n=1 Tax=Streptomyces purpurogeneiscleroticus TaxID=68259 RepID=UPI001CBCEEEF|nr:protein kinase [Streptomyces purpurogeneiscleroticus]